MGLQDADQRLAPSPGAEAEDGPDVRAMKATA